MRAVALLAVALACSTSQRSMVSSWPVGSTGATCATHRGIEWAAYKAPGYDLRDVTRTLQLMCDADGIALWETDVAAGTVVEYPSTPGSFDAAYGSALARVNDADCYTREDAIAGKHLPSASATVSLGNGKAHIACAVSPAWSGVSTELERQVKEAHARFPGPLPTCCSSKRPCQDEIGKTCW